MCATNQLAQHSYVDAEVEYIGRIATTRGAVDWRKSKIWKPQVDWVDLDMVIETDSVPTFSRIWRRKR